MPRRFRHCNRLPAAPSRFAIARGHVPAFIETALVAPRAGLAAPVARERMAEDFRATGDRGLTRAEMLQLGWTNEQIDALSPSAIVRAQQLAGAAL